MVSPAPTGGRAINFTELLEHPSGDFSPCASDPQIPKINCTAVSGLVSAFVRNSLAPNTLRAYASDVETFRQWGGRVPTSPQVVAEFLAAHARSRAPSTLSRYLAAISKAHRVRSLPDPTSSELVKATMRGIRRSAFCLRDDGAVKPLMRDDLFKVLDTMGASLVDYRDRALLILGFAGALRRSELIGLDVRDLGSVSQGLVVTLRRSKTDQLHEGWQLSIPRGHAQHCPVKSLEQWLGSAGIVTGPVFRPVNKTDHVSEKRLSGEAVSLVIKRRLVAAGIDSTAYSGHSLRAGFVTSAAIAGVPIWKIRKHTRHATDQAVAGYIRAGMFSEQSVIELLL